MPGPLPEGGCLVPVMGAIGFGTFAVVAFWVIRADDAYLRRYRELRDIDVPLFSELLRTYGSRINYSLVDPEGIAARVRAFKEPQDDPELEKLRRRERRRLWIGSAIVVLAFFVAVSLPPSICQWGWMRWLR